MKHALKFSAAIAIALLCAVPAYAQAPTADQVVEKHLAALGGRAALEKLTTQVATGTLSVSTPMGDVGGSVEIYRKVPNKARSLMVLDLSALGGTDMTVDQRCDGVTAYTSNSMRGDREVTGDQLQGMLNAYFPSPLLNYKEMGAAIELAGTDKVGDRDAHVLVFTPKAGPTVRSFFDTETFHILRTITTVDIPEAGGPLEQTSEPRDYRAVDGIQIPFTVTVTNPAQTITITLSKVELNTAIDDAMFSRPAK